MKKRLLSLLLVFGLAFSVVGCGKSSSDDTSDDGTGQEEEETVTYNVVACVDSDVIDSQYFLEGFSDALSDYLGDGVTVTVISTDDDTNTDEVASQAVEAEPDLIFTTGKKMLLSATTATDTIPIVATGVVDFKGTLRIVSTDGSSWDRTTGMNVTGVSSKPSIVDQVSLMIEATDDLQAVGLLFSPEDTDSIYQNEIFETYLDQAGIPWKEYIIPASDTAIEEEESDSSEALSPNKYVAASAKEGMDNDVVSIGEESGSNSDGINSPSSTRVAAVSQYWTSGKVVTEDADDSDEESVDDTNDESTDSEDVDTSASSDTASDSIITDLTLDERIQQVCDECSAIYIPYGSMLTDQMDTITSLANENGVVTVAGDTTVGQSAYVTLFSDPYDQGYSAGKKAVKVFNGSDISTIKITYADTDVMQKLYKGDTAQLFGQEFPKSFSEFNEFFETYEYGSKTTRYVATEE